MGIMRIEKGHVTGAELDGRTTADDVGLGRMAGTKKWYVGRGMLDKPAFTDPDRSEEHTSELQSLMRISYAVFCLKQKTPTLAHAYAHTTRNTTNTLTRYTKVYT